MAIGIILVCWIYCIDGIMLSLIPNLQSFVPLDTPCLSLRIFCFAAELEAKGNLVPSTGPDLQKGHFVGVQYPHG